MAELLIINGPPGVGKTTVARHLAGGKPGTVCVHGDDLRAFAPADARAHLGGGSTYRAAAALVRAYLGMGATRVLFDYVFLRRSHVEHFFGALGDTDAPVTMFTLWAPLAVVEAREAERPLRSPLGEAVRECWEEIDRNRAHLGRFIAADTASVGDIARQLDP